MIREIETRELLADTRGYGRHLRDKSMRSHAVEVVDGEPVRVICGRVKLDNLADKFAGDYTARPTCERCATRWDKAIAASEEPHPLACQNRECGHSRIAHGKYGRCSECLCRHFEVAPPEPSARPSPQGDQPS